MNAQSKEVILASMSVAERAANALSREETEAEILALVGKSKPIVAVTDNASREVCHTSLMELVDLRVLISKRGKAGREEANQYSKAVIAIEKDLIALLTPEEGRLAKLRDDFDAAKKAAKEAEIQKELLRQKSHRENVAKLQNWCLALTPSNGSECIHEWMLALESLIVDESYEEFLEQGEAAKAASLARLLALLNAAMAHEEAQRKLEADRAEIQRLKAEETERQRIAAEERTRQEVLDKASREAEALSLAKARAEQEAAAKVARDAEKKRMDEESAKNKRIAKEELDRVARNEMAMQELQSIHHQLIIAETGRAPYCKGGDLQTMDWLLAETEKWPITEERFGALFGAATKAKETVLASLRQKRVDIERQAQLDRRQEEITAQQEALRKAQEPVPEVQAPAGVSAPPAPLQAGPDLKEIPQDQGASLDEPLDALQLAVLLGRARYYVVAFEPRTEEEEEAQSQLLSEIDEVLPGESVAVTAGRTEDWDDGRELPF